LEVFTLRWFKKKAGKKDSVSSVKTEDFKTTFHADLHNIGGRVIVPDDLNSKNFVFAVRYEEPVSLSKFVNAVQALSEQSVSVMLEDTRGQCDE